MSHVPAKNWFTVLMSPKGGHVDAAWTLLASGTAPPLDVTAQHDGIPVMGFFERDRRRDQFWESLFDDREHAGWRTWKAGFGSLPLSADDDLPIIPAFPNSGGDYDSSTWATRLNTREAIFARLVAMGANPWESWTRENDQQVDGFDVAVAWGCTPLVDLCLRHPACPPLEELHTRKAWTIREPKDWKDEKGRAIFTETDGILTAVAASAQPCLVKLLLDNGWSAEGLGKGVTPLAVARNSDTVQHLMDAGAAWKPDITTFWQHLAKKSKAHQESLPARMTVVGKRNQGGTDPLDQAMAMELLEAFKKNERERISRVFKTHEADNPDLKWTAKEVATWKKLDGARQGKRGLILEAAMFGLGSVACKHIVRCRNLMGHFQEHAPNQDLDGSSVVGMGHLLTIHSHTKPTTRGGYTIHTGIRDAFDAMAPEIKVKTLLDTFRTVSRNGTRTQETHARISLAKIFDDLCDKAQISGEDLAQGNDVLARHFLGKRAIQNIDRWLEEQPLAVQAGWIKAMEVSDYPEGLEHIVERLEADRSWQQDVPTAQAFVATIQSLPAKGTGRFEEPLVRLRRLALEATAQPMEPGDRGQRGMKM